MPFDPTLLAFAQLAPAREVVVVAPRLPPAAGDPAFGVMTLDAETLRRDPRLDEALGRVPGVGLFRRTPSLSANPTIQGLSLRNIAPSGAGRALVTLDGVPLNDPFGGWVIWTQIPPEGLDGAAIVRGGGSGPYGAGALTGTVALSEADAPQILSLEAGQDGYLRGAAAGAATAGLGTLAIVVADERTDGYVATRGAGRGAADRAIDAEAASVAARLTLPLGPATVAARVGAFSETRGAGLAGADSTSEGAVASLTGTAPLGDDGPTLRGQVWVRGSDLRNVSVAVADDRAATRPASLQERTPALGYGGSLALRGGVARNGTGLSWELGADARATEGEVVEFFRDLGAGFTRRRTAGGRTEVAGLYAEAAWQSDDLLVAGGVRLDRWTQDDAVRREFDTATGARLLDAPAPDREGLQPSVRLALRRGFADGWFGRVAGYTSFRPPTLNELHRPFRVGNDVTEANPLLEPERLAGVEAGIGVERTDWSLSVTAFYNRLGDPVTNVTLAQGPGSFGVAGFIPAGGSLRQRQNAGRIEAVGLEAEATARWEAAGLDGRVALALTDAEVQGTGLRPAQAPEWAATAALAWTPRVELRLDLDLRYEGARFEDDLNTRDLSAAVTLDAALAWQLADGVEITLAADNLFDAEVEVAETGTGIESFGPPRRVRAGLRFGGGDD